MKYVKQAINYCAKNFLYLFLMALVPSIFVGILCKPFKLFEFLRIYSSTPIINFGTMFNALYDFKFVSILLNILSLLIIIVFISAMLGFIENHMRSGKRSVNSIKNYINNNLLSVSSNVVIATIIYFALVFLLSALLFLLHIMLSGLNASPTVFNFILAIIFVVAVFLILIYTIVCIMVNIVNMNINGYPLKDGIASTIKNMGKNFWQILIAFSLPFVLIIPLVILSFGTGFIYFVSIISTLLLLIYYSALSSVVYFDITQTKRYDNRKYYNPISEK